MSSVVYKHKLSEMPNRFVQVFAKHTKILDVQLQDGIPTMWTMQDTTEPEYEERTFICLYTGTPYSNMNLWTHLKTLQLPNGLVIHYFEI